LVPFNPPRSLEGGHFSEPPVMPHGITPAGFLRKFLELNFLGHSKGDTF